MLYLLDIVDQRLYLISRVIFSKLVF